ncbi:hypothetical protein OUZ56_032019 [Daphnia magna]|uniref:Uncharacterized protein n=1 Tax=Daphnia magna TaxID=35525 RepID=A0ABQ9ZX04_9CRUS|nr:hypothetical protein OUZ56_032019 [Daphnia magna]
MALLCTPINPATFAQSDEIDRPIPEIKRVSSLICVSFAHTVGFPSECKDTYVHLYYTLAPRRESLLGTVACNVTVST